MPDITIARQYGAGGGEIADAVARSLGWPLLDREFVDEVASRLGTTPAAVEAIEERVPSLVERIADSLAFSAPEVTPPPFRPGRLLGPRVPGLPLPHPGRLGPLSRAPARDLPWRSRSARPSRGRAARGGDAGAPAAERRVLGRRAVSHPTAFAKWGLRPVTELFAAHGISEAAQAVLLGEQGDYAVRPSKTPTVMAAGLTGHYMRGAFYPEGGGQVLAARLIEAIRAHGGELRTRAPVASGVSIGCVPSSPLDARRWYVAGVADQ